MAQWRDDPDRAADELIVKSLDDLDLHPAAETPIVLVDAGQKLRATLFATRGYRVEAVARRASALEPTPSVHVPPEMVGTPRIAFVRLPKSKDELEFTLHRTIGWLARLADSRVYLYGGNDEGIRSAAKRLGSLNVAIATVAAHSHGRVLSVPRPHDLAPVRVDDGQWRNVGTMKFADGVERPWITYPGLFAGGRLDDATALLLQHLPVQQAGARVLDYGCGTGVIARALLERDANTRVTALDADHFALEATRENAPAAKPLQGFRLKGAGRHDLIVSNPPIHNGFREDYTALHQLIEDAPLHLLPRGRLLLVVQRRVPVEAQLKAKFQLVEIIADDGPFRIWSASSPTKRTEALATDDVEIVEDDGEDW